MGEILSGEQRETIVENIHAKLIEVGEQVNEGKLLVELYQITKVCPELSQLGGLLLFINIYQGYCCTPIVLVLVKTIPALM